MSWYNALWLCSFGHGLKMVGHVLSHCWTLPLMQMPMDLRYPEGGVDQQATVQSPTLTSMGPLRDVYIARSALSLSLSLCVCVCVCVGVRGCVWVCVLV